MMAPLLRSAFAVCTILLPTLAHGVEGEDRWRLLEDGDQLSLYIADTDLGTDHIGSTWFGCKRASGRVSVGADMNEQEREAFAELIRSDKDPFIELIPATPNEGSVATISHSAMTGWQYKFEMSAEAPAFSNFTKTGVLEFRVGDFLIRTEFNTGIENSAKFQTLCRSSTPR